MWHFDSNNELYTEVKAFVAALASTDCMSAYEQARIGAVYDRLASGSIVLTGYEVGFILDAIGKLFTRKYGANN